MEKNWLIRTGQNQVLGPVTKDKVKELIKSGSLELEDEVCSGNGYWFKIKEEELVDKYLNGDYIQSFNPVSEAKSILTSPKGKKIIWPVIFFLIMSSNLFFSSDNIKAQDFPQNIKKKKV
ncbi:MAG: hypothetical protein DRQ88_09935 [Epsilonproteobacteria bacterium]|nr:MAG: hypothetical protein DRQ89_10440 [Campylobacterota bacterium]RLA65017.1 MAG: hypothetical protein DRQ88_09935 [Campylobacterota bacterium]